MWMWFSGNLKKNFQWYFNILYSHVMNPWSVRLVLWLRVRVVAVVSHFASPSVRVQTPVTEGDKQIDSIREKESSRCERDISSILCGLENMLLCWGDDHSSSASQLPRMLTLISSIQCNFSMNQPMFREMERTAKSPAAPIYSMSSSHPSPGVWSHPPPPLQLILHILLSLSPPISFFPSRCNTLLWKKMHDLWSSIFTGYRGERKERRSHKERERKRGRRMEGSVWEWAQGEGGQENVKETSISLRPRGLKWRWVAGGDRNMMDLTKIRGESTCVVYCYTLYTFWWLILSLIFQSFLCNIFCQ